MLHAAFLYLVIGQVPPPPAPYRPESNAQSSEDPKAQRQWLLDHLTADLQAQGKLDTQKYRDIERMVNGVSDSQVAQAVQYYQAQELAAAQANLRRLQAYRDRLKAEVARRQVVYQQEQAMAAYSSALAAQQAQGAMQNFYGAPAWSYYYAPRPYYYRRW